MARSLNFLRCIVWFAFNLSGNFLLFPQKLEAQFDKYSAVGWQLMDYRQDSVFGAGVNKAYSELLKGMKSTPVIVAVIDTGLDTAHSDLIGHIWTNQKEIPGNGKDDDHNGYVDDVHGWNFLGGKNGKRIEIESMESYREFYRLSPFFSKSSDSLHTPEEIVYWQKVKNLYLEDSLKTIEPIITVSNNLIQIIKADSILRSYTHKEAMSGKDIIAFQPMDSVSAVAKKSALGYYTRNKWSDSSTLSDHIKKGSIFVKDQQKRMEIYGKDPNALRREIVGDDWDNINDRSYGNNDITAGNSSHGTHVAGIIAASRNNGIGMDGIDDNVWIMPIRVIPYPGDERDKDVALAIKYAVDNGAKIINMSLGKHLSPGKKWVNDAVKYAEKKDVLIIHAAGNNTQDIDTVAFYPIPDLTNMKQEASNFVTVGASSGGPDSMVVASFSNYGSRKVDLFAPGVNIYSTIPDNNYEFKNGTSMASPVVSGIAALILEYYPRLSARQLKYVLTHSTTQLADPMVVFPINHKLINFTTLSKSGGIVNAYNAIQLAATLKGERAGH
jgi:cell wall-associated protease